MTRSSGEIAISLQGELAARRFLNDNPAARIRLRLCQIGRPPDLIGIAVPPGRYDLLHWVNVFLEDRHIDFDAAQIVAHQGPLSTDHPDCKGSVCNVLINWENGEQTCEPLCPTLFIRR